MEVIDRNDKLPPLRMKIVQVLLVAGVLWLVYGLWQLQVLQAEKYVSLAEHNRVRNEPIPAPRGRILDRDGRVIVDNYPSFSIYLVRDLNRQWHDDLAAIAAGLNLDPADLDDRLKRVSAPVFQPLPVKDDVTAQDVAFVAAHRDEYPELETVMVPKRLYPKDGFAAHLIGYVGEPDAKQLASGQFSVGAVVGKSGVEQAYNAQLTGKDGERRLLVDSRGRVVGELSDEPPLAGRDLRLTIDDDMQIAAEQALGDQPGAVVALDPRSGDVLALASRPTFDANLFAAGVSSRQWQQWLNDPDHPLLDKAIQAQLAPGSVFKLVMAVAGMQEKVAQNMVVNCQGGIDYHGQHFACWVAAEGRVHGRVDLAQAVMQSCDVYFYTLGDQLGIDTIDRYAQQFGLGRPTGVDLPHEASGLVPTPAWKQSHQRQNWFGGDTLNLAIGQGALNATPLQLAHTVGGLAMGGDFRRPHLQWRGDPPPPETGDFTVPLAPDTMSVLDSGMRGVVADGGTAASAHLDGLDFGGKTGTAQTVSLSTFKTLSGAAKREYTDNAWFVGVYPVEHPEIVVSVLLERGAEGAFASRVASEVVAAYYHQGARRRIATAAIQGTP